MRSIYLATIIANTVFISICKLHIYLGRKPVSLWHTQQQCWAEIMRWSIISKFISQSHTDWLFVNLAIRIWMTCDKVRKLIQGYGSTEVIIWSRLMYYHKVCRYIYISLTFYITLSSWPQGRLSTITQNKREFNPYRPASPITWAKG